MRRRSSGEVDRYLKIITRAKASYLERKKNMKSGRSRRRRGRRMRMPVVIMATCLYKITAKTFFHLSKVFL
jgi:hypothetical protein